MDDDGDGALYYANDDLFELCTWLCTECAWACSCFARVGECVDAPISERSAYELGWGLAGFKDLLHYHWTATGVPLSVWGVD